MMLLQGFAIGPMVWGPMSELFGRTRPLFFGFVVMAIFQIPVAVAQNLYTVLICRFLGGVFGSSPLAIAGGALVDVWDAVMLAKALITLSIADASCRKIVA